MSVSLYSGLGFFCVVVMSLLTINIFFLKNRLKPRNIIVTFVCATLFVIVDFLWGLNQDDHIILNESQSIGLNILYSMLSTLTACAWAEYVMKECDLEKHRRICCLLFGVMPFAVIMIMNVASIWTDWVFAIDSLGYYAPGEYFGVYAAFASVPLLFSVVPLAYRIKTSNLKDERNKFFLFEFSTVLILVAAYVSELEYLIPVLAVCVSLAMISVLLAVQDRMIRKDAISNLDNQFMLDKTLSGFLDHHHANGKTISVAVFDFDAFKVVVSMMGHSKSGQIVQNMADILRGCCRRKPLIPASFGNNAFAVVCYGAPEILEKTCVEFTEKIAEYDKTVPYTVHYSYGISTTDEEGMDTSTAMTKLAEKRMRIAKEQYYKLIGYKRER